MLTEKENGEKKNKGVLVAICLCLVSGIIGGAYYFSSSQSTPADSALRDQLKADPLAIATKHLPPHGAAIIASAKQLQTLDLSDCDNLTAQDLSSWIQLPLANLNLSGNALDLDKMQAIAKLPKLVKLDLSHSDVTSDALVGLAGAPQLESLDLSRTKVDRKIFQVLQDLPKIRSVRLAEDPDLARDATSLDFASVKVTEWDLSADSINDEALSKLSRAQQIKVLILDGNPTITATGLNHLTKIRSLKEMHFNNCDLIYALSLFNWQTGYKYKIVPTANTTLQAQIAAGKNLIDLRFSPVKDDDLAPVAKAKKLRQLDLNGCTNITDKGVHYLRNTNIDELNLDQTNITSACLQDLSTMQKMQSLSLMTTQKLRSIAGLKILPELYVLNLAGDPLDDQSMDTIVKMPKLVKLIYPNGRPSVIKHLIQLLPKSAVNEIFLCRNELDDSDMVNLARVTKLETLDLTTNNVTGVGLRALTKLPVLTNLKLADNKGITEQDLKEFRATTHGRCVIDR